MVAISSYAELQDLIADYLARSDLTTRIPTFIQLAEARMNRVLRDLENETIVTLTPDADGIAALPTNYRQWRSVNAVDDTTDLEFLSPPEAERRYGLDSGTPRAFTVMGQNLIVYPASTTDVVLVYYAMLDPLSATNAANWVLEKHPDAYIFGALSESAAFIGDDGRVTMWEQKFQGAMDDIRASDQGARWGRSVVQVPWGTPV